MLQNPIRNLVFCLVLLSACTISNGSRVPSLSTGAADNWCDTGLQTVLVTARDNGAQIINVNLRFARHTWPDDGDLSRTHLLDYSDNLGSAYTFEIPSNLQIQSTQRVIFRAEIAYREEFGAEIELMQSELDTMAICCDNIDFEQFLIEDQEVIVERFGSFDSGWPGWPGEKFGDDVYKYQAAHGKCCYRGMGVAIARAEDDHQLIWGYPNVLLYAPDPNTDEDDLCDQNKDFPYELIGWAYAIPYAPGSPPPGQCIPFEEWFVHEAGYHYLNSGDFCITPPDEAFPGEIAIADANESDASCSGTCTACPRHWHSRLWDIHIWRNDGGVPKLGIEHPDGIPEGCSATLPNGSFFYPEHPF